MTAPKPKMTPLQIEVEYRLDAGTCDKRFLRWLVRAAVLDVLGPEQNNVDREIANKVARKLVP
jgi:hypothetical protein